MIVLQEFPLKASRIPSVEGLQRAIVTMPRDAHIVFLGSIPPDERLAIVAQTSAQPADQPLIEQDLVTMEFLIAVSGNIIPPGCVIRSTIRGPQGLIFLYQRTQTSPQIIVPGGQG